MGAIFGSTQLTVTAFGNEADAEQLAGVLYAVLGVGSLIGSFAYGLREWQLPLQRRPAIAGLVLAGGAASALLLSSREVLPLSLFLMGCGVGPLIVLSSLILQDAMPKRVLTQSLSAMGAFSAAGVAAGGPLAGAAVDARGFEGGLIVISVAAFVCEMCALALLMASSRQSLPERQPS